MGKKSKDASLTQYSLIYFQQPENNSFNTSDGVALNEDEYRYVLNDTTSDYNNIIPQYIENDVNDFMFSNETPIASNPVEYYNGGSNSNYAITNLDANAQNYVAASSANTFDSVMYERYQLLLCYSIFHPYFHLFSYSYSYSYSFLE